MSNGVATTKLKRRDKTISSAIPLCLNTTTTSTTMISSFQFLEILWFSFMKSVSACKSFWSNWIWPAFVFGWTTYARHHLANTSVQWMTAAMLEKECPGNSVTAISFALSLVIVASTTLNGKSNAPKDLHRSFNRSERFLFNDTEGSFM